MSPDTAASAKPLRADAQRNRDTLVAVARAAFAGPDPTVALEAIAREAGLGIGTLYRHFPTRESLVEAVYAAELDDITESVAVLLGQHPPVVALRAWMDRYAGFVTAKRGMLDTLRAGWASGRIASPTTRTRVTASIGALLDAGVRSGDFRAGVDPDDVTALLLGIYYSSSRGVDTSQTGRLLDFVVDGLRA
ncbi:TetR/AcrR family transcriptional regulator [Frondihabitans sucicola]|uniref:TetR/AcrR family transcriptional regulator n=1 Tax=Frondihabitans sucicola TaxID=1268041 RepID=UPI0025748A86|nr:TetR/AcrR family transcriptional regulator [Frondihabitans sucicola]